MNINRKKLFLGVIMAMTLFVSGTAFQNTSSTAPIVQKIVSVEQVQASEVREKGTDTAIYQGANAQKAQASDTFSIAQVGGSVHGKLYDQ